MHDISLKKNKFLNKDQVIILLFGFILLCYYYSNIENIYTIWELDDEAGYIFNASLFSKDNWREVFSNVTAYYGYGYSLILIPLFYLCDSGLALIRGVIGVNIFCILLLYFMQIAVMSKILPECKKSVLSVCSAIMCLLPYLVASSMKTICEVYLTLVVWTIAWILYKAIESKKNIYYILLYIATAYIFFVHTRSIAIVGAVWGVLLFQMLYAEKKKKAIISFVLGLVLFAISYILFNCVKAYILNILGTGTVIKQNETVINVISSNYILDRIKWLFSPENLSIYFHSVVGKLFYLIVATAGIFLFGIGYEFKRVKEKKALFLKENFLELYFVLAFILMMGLCVVSGTGDTYEYFIYGRYYEYTISFIVFMGIYYLSGEESQNILNYIWVLIIILCAGLLAARLDIFTVQNSVNLDTNRYVGFSYGISKTNDWKTLIFYMTIFSVAIMVCFALIRNIKYRIVLVLLVLLFWFLVNNEIALDKIDSTQKTLESDIDFIQNIQENEQNIPVYFIYEPYKYDKYFTRIQVHLKDKIMKVILPEDVQTISKEAYIITYIDSTASKQFRNDTQYELLSKTVHYKLYLKK